MTLPLGILASGVFIGPLMGGQRDTLFQVGDAGQYVYSVNVQSDDKVVVGGGFTYWDSQSVGYLVRINSNGTTDTSFYNNTGTGANGSVVATSIQSDGKILVGGSFLFWNGAVVYKIVRLNSDGTRDTTFTSNIGTGPGSGGIYSIDVQSDGKILVGGNFSSWDGISVGRIVRLNSDGTRDTTFTTNNGTGANDSVWKIHVQSDGKILVGGNFYEWNGTYIYGFIRLNSNGTRDTTFSANTGSGPNDTVLAINTQSDGKILVGGWFTDWNGASVGRIVRLNSDGTRDTTFTTNNGTGANDSIYFTSIQSDGKILVGGYLNSWNGTSVGYGFIRLNSDGTRDTAFSNNIGTGANDLTYSSDIQSDGKIIVGGFFTSWNGTSANGIVRLGGGNG